MQTYNNNVENLAQSEVGSRYLSPNWNKMVAIFALFWSLFQLWIASPLQFHVASYLGIQALVLNDIQIREIHLAFAFVLSFLLFPGFKEWDSDRIPLYDMIAIVLGLASIVYLLANYDEIAIRLGLVDRNDTIISIIGVIILLEASRRTVGLAITLISIIFLLYSLFGSHFPELLAYKGHSLPAIASHQWLSSEGIYGVALGVSANFVFMYVLFGALLDKAGAGNFFIQLSFALLGRFTGGPAKAAVVASGLMGMVSGSSIANTITVGTFTIPLMKKMGLSAEKAGAIEVSAGINGQIMPPVMGAAAFIIAEYLSIPYTDVVKHAFLPAVMVYIALLYIVHLEALKLGFKPLTGVHSKTFLYRTLRFCITNLSIFIIFAALYYIIEGAEAIGFAGIKGFAGDYSGTAISVFIILSYVLVLRYQSKYDDLLDTDRQANVLPKVSNVFRTGIHHFIPLVILVWCLIVEKLSPALSAYWTIVFLAVSLLTQHSIKAFFRSQNNLIVSGFKRGADELFESMILGAKNMTVVAIATATAGIIVGTVSLTGIGLKISNIVDVLSNGSVIITLFVTAFICIVLGMGMPTTACYIIVSTIMVPVLDHVLMKNAIVTPKLAIHLFVFYFGLMADVTPPVGLASYAAAAVARADPFKTGVQAFLYNMRTMTLPFIFIFNPSIMLYGVDDIASLISVITTSIVGILVVAAGTQGYFIIRSKLWESCVLLCIGFSLLFPKFWVDKMFAPVSVVDLTEISNTSYAANTQIRLALQERNLMGEQTVRYIIFTPTMGGTMAQYIDGFGINIGEHEDGVIHINNVDYKSEAYKEHIDYSYDIIEVVTHNKQPSSIYVLVLAFIILIVIYTLQRSRKLTLGNV